MPNTKIDPFGGAMPGESWTREFGSLPMDKAPMTVNQEVGWHTEEVSFTLLINLFLNQNYFF